jgi:hypothetical protein
LAEHRPFALIEEGWPRFVLLADPGAGPAHIKQAVVKELV